MEEVKINDDEQFLTSEDLAWYLEELDVEIDKIKTERNHKN